MGSRRRRITPGWGPPGAKHASVVGTVALSGTVIAHEIGYRAELARPQQLRLICQRCLPVWTPADEDGFVVKWPERPQIGVRCGRHCTPLERVLAPARQAQDQLLNDYGAE